MFWQSIHVYMLYLQMFSTVSESNISKFTWCLMIDCMIYFPVSELFCSLALLPFRYFKTSTLMSCDTFSPVYTTFVPRSYILNVLTLFEHCVYIHSLNLRDYKLNDFNSK